MILSGDSYGMKSNGEKELRIALLRIRDITLKCTETYQPLLAMKRQMKQIHGIATEGIFPGLILKKESSKVKAIGTL